MGNPGVKTSLRCFQHPLTWLSVALLLLNDHLLKALAPCWLTGKLSDFSGLFFFPLLLAAGLSLFLDRLRCPARLSGAISFALTGTWFVLLKTVPAANALTAQLASGLLGTAVHYALDPTDLLALAALLPAWWLWNHPPSSEPRRAARVALAAGLLASLATSPLPPPYHVDRVGSADGVVYALDSARGDAARSSDGGVRWAYLAGEEEPPPGVFHEVAFPFVGCDPVVPQDCFRITGAEEVEASTNGGQSWQVAWTIPPGRRDFMQRYQNPLSGRGRQDFAPLDLTFFGYGGDRYVLVAMGDEGVMRRRLPDGEWERRKPSGGSSTPYAVTEHTLAYVPWEATIGLALAELTVLGSGLLVWLALRKRLESALVPERSATWALLPLVVGALVGLALTGLASIIPLVWYVYETASALAIVILLSLGLAPVLIGLGVTGRRIADILSDPGPAKLALRIGLLTAASLLFAGTVPWALWVAGAIAFYSTALLVVLLVDLVILGGGLTLVWVVAREAAGPEQGASGARV